MNRRGRLSRKAKIGFGIGVGVFLLIIGLASSCGSPTANVSASSETASSQIAAIDQIEVPNVLDLNLRDAKARLQPDLDATSVDATGQDRMQIVDSNWQVAQQNPTAGTRVQKGSTVTLHVIRPGEVVASPTASPTEAFPLATQPVADQPAITQPVPQATVGQPAPQPASTARPADPPPPPPPAAANPPANDPIYANCAEARAAGVAPLRSGQPGYSTRLDRDGDGVACE